MYKYSDRSKKNLESCDKRIQLICFELIKRFDCSVIDGYRDEIKQTEYYNAIPKKSKLQYPNSKHNTQIFFPHLGYSIPQSQAFDIIPYPTGFKKLLPFYYMAGEIDAIAYSLKIKIRWGGDFNKDLNFYNDKWLDLAHFAIIDGEHKYEKKGGYHEKSSQLFKKHFGCKNSRDNLAEIYYC